MHRSEAPKSLSVMDLTPPPAIGRGFFEEYRVKSFRSGALGALLAVALGSNYAHALGAPAGTVINNTAEVSYSVGSVNTTATSNQVSVTVAEILDVVVTAQTPTVAVNAGDTQQEVRYRITNTGNGTETFRLVMTSVIAGDQFDPVPATPSIYFDTDNSGDLSPGDTPYVVASNDPVLSADGFVTVLVVNDIPAGVVDTNVGFTRLTADSRTGTGTPGTVFATQGDGGVDAVVGTTGADSEANSSYVVSGVSLTATKSQTVLDQFGGSRPVPGARINYSIVVNVTGSGTATNAVFTDNIPANTTYVPGTLQLNAGALSDAADADAGDYLSTPTARVRVSLGNLTTASGPQTVTFAVTIN
jgi:uncharacterized repeat protein (TIGR01451 family)